MSQDIVTCSGLFKVAETEKAVAVSYDEYDEAGTWLPKSLIEEDDLKFYEQGSVEIPQWLADREELNYV